MNVNDENESEVPESESSLNLADVFNETSYSQPVRTRREFAAWHRPRKQVVRQIQWGSEIEWLLSQKSPEDLSLRYLGLPGADLLDIRYFYSRFCRGGEHYLTFLGFDESAKPGSTYRDALNVSLNEVRRFEHIDERSDVVGDDFRRLSDDQSIAWELAQRLGPFDIINLDLCGHMARDEPAIDPNYYNAIYQLCGLQQRQRGPWSLFLTSRLDQVNFANDTLDKLLKVLESNLDRCGDFAVEFHACFGALQYTVETAKAWDSETFFKTMSVAIAKWFLVMAQSMRNVLSISSVAGYQINKEAHYLDMVSIALRFMPSAAIGPDRTGLASGASPLADECMQAAPFPKKVSGTMDIDKALRDSPGQWVRFRDATGELLEQARYSAAAYRDWANDDSAKNGRKTAAPGTQVR